MNFPEQADSSAEHTDNNPSRVSERARISNEFVKLFVQNNIEDVKEFETQSIDQVREHLMERYTKHLLAYGLYDEDDEDEMDTVEAYLTQALNRDLRDVEVLDGDDFVRIGGNAIYIQYDGDEGLRKIFMLRPNEFLEGVPEAVAIVETPTSDTMMRMQEHIIEADELLSDTDRLGAILVLKNALVVSNKGVHARMGENSVIGVVMSNPDMSMSKYIL